MTLRWLVIGITVITAGCGGQQTPSAPSAPSIPAPSVPEVPQATTITGSISATNGGQPLAGITVESSSSTVITNAQGVFSFHFSGTAAPYSFPVTVSGPGVVTRKTHLNFASRNNVALGLFSLANGFDMAYYRELARGGGLDRSPRELRPWTSDPSIYIHTVDDRNRALDPQALSIVETTIRDTIGLWTGGRLKIAAVEYGNEDRQGRAGWISVTWGGENTIDYCGFATAIGLEGTVIELDTRTPGCRCAGLAVDPAVVRHELGHALGFSHTSQSGDVMFPTRSGSCQSTLSAREREYAAYAYSRPRGNTDPDDDPAAAVFAVPSVRR
jgi:Matrixin